MINSMATKILYLSALISLLVISKCNADADANPDPDANPDADANPDPDANPDADADADPEPVLKIIQKLIKRKKVLGSHHTHCNDHSDCTKDYSYCIKGLCKCLSNFKENYDHSCTLIGGPGSPCSSNDDCKEINSTCENGKCVCPEGWVTDRSCCFPTTGYGGECKKVIQCPNQIYFDCRDGQCLCSDKAVDIGGACLPKQNIGGSCQDVQQCSQQTPNSDCVNGMCACPVDFQLNQAGDECVPDTINIDLVIETEDAWNPNYSDPNHPDTIAYRAIWDEIISNVTEIISVESMTFENNTGKTLVRLTVKVANPDKAETRRRRRSVEELKEKEPEGGAGLVKTLKERDVQQLSAPITVSAPDILMPEDVDQMDQFCLQDIDCPSNVCSAYSCM